MTTNSIHIGKRWLASLTETLLLVIVMAGLASVRSADAQQVPLLTVTKAADNATINAGEEIGFTITISSTNNGDVTLVQLTDELFNVLPSAPNWTESPDNASCTIDGSNLLSCNFASIPSGAPPIILHVAALATEQDCGQTGNQALIAYDDFNGRSHSDSSNTASVEIICPTATSTPTDTPTGTPTDTPTSTPTAVPTETPTNTPTEAQTPDPSATATTVPLETAIPATEEPTDPPTSTPTSDTTGGVTELPDTGGTPGSDPGGSGLWPLVALLAVVGLGIGGVRARART